MNFKIYFFIITLFFVSCSNSSEENSESETQTTNITITKEQFAQENMRYGQASFMKFTNEVNCNGNIVLQPIGIFEINPSVPGKIKNILVRTGQLVKKGQILFEISGNEIIEIQRGFAEAAGVLFRLESEYKRTKALYDDKIISEKDFMAKESEYKIAKANYSALKLKVYSMGLNTTEIEKGEFYNSYRIKSPVEGYISAINISNGKFAEQETSIAEIIDPTKFHLHLNIFEKDVSKIAVNQFIVFRLINNTKFEYNAKISFIGKTINPETKTISVFADLENTDFANLINNIYVEAKIITESDSAMAIPDEAIIYSEEEAFVLEFVTENETEIEFKKVKIEPGRKNNGYTEIIGNKIPEKILTSGTYNIIL
ncbi:MAG: efflux RND transporter periplasmic adaptor subunit [Bacteroidales bacterium]|nr:efflux RND transporter periplasmic adaptor subunit [Bacteroidales bacterium]